MITVALAAVLLIITSLLPIRLTVKYSVPSTLVLVKRVILVHALVSPVWNNPTGVVKE